MPDHETSNIDPRSFFLRSGFLTVLALALLLGLLVFGCRTRHQDILENLPVSHHVVIGGQEPVVLSRAQSDGGLLPEFVSATMLPNRGMNLMQITAYLPGIGQVPLLFAPTPEQINAILADPTADRNGAATTSFGGAFLLPLDSRVSGTLSADGQNIGIPWHGRTLQMPTDVAGAPYSSIGLFNDQTPSSVEVDDQPDGQIVTAIFEPGNFNGRWPSTTEVTIIASLTRKAVELTVTAQNTGNAPEPMSIGWRPYFVVPSGLRSEARLHLPPSDRLETDANGNLTGRSLPLDAQPYDFTVRGGYELGSLPVDMSLVNLHAGMEVGINAEIQDRADKFGLRVIPVSPTIKSFHVISHPARPVITLSPLMSPDEPFSKAAPESPGVVTLAPGESVVWKLRLEIFLAPQRTALP